MPEQETQNVETQAVENQENKQPEKQLKRMVVFEYQVLNGENVRGIPNIISQDESMIDPDWTTSNAEIQMDNKTPDYMAEIGKKYRAEQDLAGVMLIKHIGKDQYWLVPVGVPDFVLLCVETARNMKLHVVE